MQKKIISYMYSGIFLVGFLFFSGCSSGKALAPRMDWAGPDSPEEIAMPAADDPALSTVTESSPSEDEKMWELEKKEEAAGENWHELDLVSGDEELNGSGGDADTGKDDSDTADAGIDLARQLATRSDYRSKAPELLSRINGTDLEALPFVVNDIYVVIAGHRARVVYDMVFQNPTVTDLSGTIMIELPDGGSPCYLGMFQGPGLPLEPAASESANPLPQLGLNPVPLPLEQLTGKDILFTGRWRTQQGEIDWGELRSARVVNPVKGKEVYEAITRRKVDPALAEWAGGNKFSTRVYPLPANSYKRIVFAYDRPLISEGRQLLYILPLPAEIGALTRMQVYMAGDHFSEVKVLAGDKELTPFSRESGERWQFNPGESFRDNLVFYGIPWKEDVQILSGTDPAIEGQLVHVRYKPELVASGEDKKTGRALFLLDTSYSTRAALSAASGKMLRALLEADTTIGEFAVITFDVLTRPLQETFLKNNPENREQVLARVEKIWLEGATSFTGLLEFLEGHPHYLEADAVFLLSDGQITWGGENTRELASRFSPTLAKPWFCYSFGDLAVNRELFDLLARQGGQVVHVATGQGMEEAALAHRQRRIPLDYVQLHNGDDLLIAGDPVNLFPGQVLEMAARLYPGERELHFSISLAGSVSDVRVPLANVEELNGLATRSWAELYVNKMLGLYDATADQAALALSQHFALTNREASFIILETDAEYEEYELRPELFHLEPILTQVQNRLDSSPYGAPDLSRLPPDALGLLDALEKLGERELFTHAPEDPLHPLLQAIFNRPAGEPEKRSAASLYKWSRALLQQGSQVPQGRERALRILSGIIEDAPRDDIAARLVGYVLLEWQMYRAAGELFARIRKRRPFEPQNYLLEGLSLVFQGRLNEAAACYEIVLRDSFSRFDSFVKPVAALFYRDMLSLLISEYSADPIAELCKKRLAQLKRFQFSRGRLVLFWNLDDTDVDLHVIEDDGFEVYYSEPESPAGGILYWDNTTGLGPEMYAHPHLSRSGFEVFVNYFGSSSVEGVAPAATLVCVFDYFEGNPAVRARCYATILAGIDEDKVNLMPPWSR